MSSKTRVSVLKGINTRKPLALALCLMSWSIAPAAQADDAVLPTVTVTASPPGALAPTSGYAARTSQAANKTDTPLAEIDQSVSVITRQQIEDQSPRTLSQALNYTPGVYSASIGSSTRYDYIVLRGFNGHVNLNEWLDGLRLLGDAEGNNAPQIDPWAVERIDVVRGP
ncbi:MAG: TonB-dependent receptor plug domain-containing protein, partial [Paludibacterium sp.]|uniref:TonB-dependent receptor plug domain-containing protein n=1 Tax=Paludibacterium sp. TaxID=1917523 RepID=UPI0025D89D1F